MTRVSGDGIFCLYRQFPEVVIFFSIVGRLLSGRSGPTVPKASKPEKLMLNTCCREAT